MAHMRRYVQLGILKFKLNTTSTCYCKGKKTALEWFKLTERCAKYTVPGTRSLLMEE